MESVFNVVIKLFNNIFVTNGSIGRSFLNLIILYITRSQYLLFGIIFVIIGFSISILSRIIHS